MTFAPGKTGQTFVVTTNGFPTNGAMAITTGTLPSGLALTNNNDGTATLAGTPAAGTAGTYPLTLTADNGVSPNATQSFTLNITCPTIAVSGTIPTLRFDSAMTAAQFSQTGGNGTIAWSATTLPGGTSIDGSSGAVTGTPTHTGTFAAVITATDAGGCIGTKGQGVAVAPDPVDDTYATGLVDNTQLVITGGTTASPTTPFVAATGKLITNDKPSGGVTLTAGTFATSAGGSVTIAADGTFVYTPELNSGAAANTSDTFDYTISSDTAGTGTPVSDTGTATLTLVGRIWYVRNNSTAGGNGQSHAPFDTLAEAGTASTAGDTIFVYAGDDTSTGHGAIALKANQTLWGQGVAFTQGGVSIAVGNLPLLAGTVSLADGVRVNSVRIASGGAIAIDGGTSNTVTFSDVTVSGGTTGLRFTGGNGTVVWTRGSIGDVTSRHVDIQDRSGGSVSFDCGIGGAGTGIFLDGNANTTFSFTGGVLLSTGSNTAFTATNGGTVTVIGAGNTLTTTTGTALNVVDTNIGSGGLIFQRISAGTASTSTGPGISLRRTGSVGGLTVTGTGTPGSGGTIRNKSAGDQAVNGSGIYLFETANVSLSWMQLNDFSNFAILGLAVHNLTLHRVVVNGTNGDNGGYDEASVAFGNSMFTGITGTATITDSTFSNSASSAEDTFRLRQATGSLDRITITNSTFSCANPRGDALNFESSGSATLNVTVQDSFITAAAGDQFQFNPGSTAANDLIFARNTLSNNNAAIATGGGGVSILANGNGTFTFDLDDNTFRDAVGPAVLLVKSTGAATFSGFFRNNEIGVAGTANSGSAEGSGLKIQNAGLGTVTVAVTDNVITQYNNYGIELMTGGGASALGGTLNATVTGNVITDPGNTPGALGIAKNGIHVNAGTVPGDTYLLALDIGGAGALANSVANAGAPNDSGAGGEDIRIRHRMDTVVQLRGYTGAANADAAVQTYILARNAIGSPSAIASNNQSTGSDGFFNTPGPGNAVPQP